jgi:hypothetical protein
MQIAVDFDGTCVKFNYPKVGEDIGAAPVLRALTAADHQLILFTMRDGDELQDAVNWFTQNKIPLFGVNTNPNQKAWTESPKAYAHLYIDDAALGAPLIYSEDTRPYIDWAAVKEYLVTHNILPQ